MNKYVIQNKEKLKKNYTTYDFQDNWDNNSIKNAINNSKNMPSFILSKIEIHASGSCNQNCKICYGKLLAPSKRTNLSAKKINSLFIDIRKNMSDEDPLIIFSGLYSEPLANPEIKEILKLTGKHKFRFGLYTNGLLIDNETMEILVKSSLGPKNIASFISFNITSSLLSGDFDKLIKIIKDLSNKRKSISNLQINAPILILKPDYEYTLNIVKRLISAGVDKIRLSIPWPQFKHPLGKTKENINKKEIIKIIENIRRQFPDKIKVRTPEQKGFFKKCYIMAMTSAISPEGDIYPCPETCSPIFKKLSYGNINKDKFSNVWQGKKHQEIFKHLHPPKNGCKCCPVNALFNGFCERIS